MQRFKLFLTSASLFALPLAFTHAQLISGSGAGDVSGDAGGVTALIQTIIGIIDTFIIPLILILGFVVFVWGMFKFFIVGAADEEARSSGKNLIIYSLLAFVLIISFWGLINFLSDSLGLEGEIIDADKIPSVNIIN